MTSPTTFTRSRAGYVLDLNDMRTELEATGLEWRRAELHGEIVVRTGLPGIRTVDGVMHRASFNFSSTRSRSDLARVLKDRAPEAGIDWAGIVELACQRFMAAERDGEPAVVLAAQPRPVPEQYIDEPLALLRHATCWFGDGDALKSYLALWRMGQVARETPVLYADFEFSARRDGHVTNGSPRRPPIADKPDTLADLGIEPETLPRDE
jgi:hypothetical protein